MPTALTLTVVNGPIETPLGEKPAHGRLYLARRAADRESTTTVAPVLTEIALDAEANFSRAVWANQAGEIGAPYAAWVTWWCPVENRKKQATLNYVSVPVAGPVSLASLWTDDAPDFLPGEIIADLLALMEQATAAAGFAAADRVQTGIDREQTALSASAAQAAAAAAQAKSRTTATWTALAALTGAVAGESAEVLDADAGTHTDPVVGGTVANAGTYSWSVSPAGWQRIGPTGLASKAPLDSPALTGAPTAPTVPPSGATNRIATTGFSEDAVETAARGLVSADRGAAPVPVGVADHRLDFAVTDSLGRLLIGAGVDGDAAFAGGWMSPPGDTSMDMAWAVTFSTGALGLGVDRLGRTHLSGAVFEQLGANDLGLVWGVVDATGRVLLGVNADGSVNVGTTFGARVEMIPSTGQSLTEGGANAAVTTNPPYSAGQALKFENGPIGKQGEVIGPELVPLAEEINETLSTGMARRLLADHPDRVVLMAGQAWGGKTLAEISLGAADGIYEKIQVQMDLAAAMPQGAVIRAVPMIHGEADGLISNATYDTDLEVFRRQFARDAMLRLGQTEIPNLLMCQTSSVSGYRNNTAARDGFTTPFLQLRAALTNPRIILVGPKYQLTYVDHSHIDALSTRLWGEKYGQVWRHVFVDRQVWLPVHAKEVTRDNDAIILNLHSPVGMAIEIDDTAVTDPGNYGFNLLDAGGVTISTVTQTGDFEITVECSGNIPDASRLSYAFHNGIYTTSGRETGARGCIRDSDPTLSIYTAAAMPNWLCAFQHIF